jgi:hypothetical protein
MSEDLIEELLGLGVLERIRYTESETAEADPGKDLPTVGVTKGFMLFLYEMKKPYTDSRYISDVVDKRRWSDIRRALRLWYESEEVEEPQNLEGMTNVVNRYLLQMEEVYPILGRMDRRRDIDSMYS